MQTEVSGESAVKLLEPGDMFGDYTVEKLLGKGGMGAVYLVHSPDGERYAVKLMFPEIAEKNADYRKRFAREAEFAMKIKHKNLISVYDVGEDPDTGFCYIIMDYVPGGSVKDRIAAKGALPVAEAVSIAAQIALALEVAHRHGVIHRDIKPDNIMFDVDGTPKLADLGVAKFTDEAHKTTVTTTGMIIGTPAYMAPEQMMDSHHIDARADIYALGVVLYEMLTGKRPTEGSSAVELLAKALKGEPLPDVRTMRPEVSAAIAHVLSLMCAPKPEERPPTTLAVAQLLQQAATGQLKLPKKRPRASDAQKAKRPFPVAACVMGALVLGAAAFGWRAWQKRTGTTGVPPVGERATGTTGVSPVDGGVSESPRHASGVPPVGESDKNVASRDTTPPQGSGIPVASRAQSANSLYCVVDLSAGPNASKYPVKWLTVPPSGGFNVDEYKTTKLVLRRIEPGKFMMGGKYEVTLTKPFYCGVFEVTQRQYELVVGTNPSRFKGDMRPVEKISYELLRGKDEGAKWPVSSAVDSSSFMGKIRIRTGIDSFDLPTEAQWEYACLAGTPNKYNDGGDSEDELKEQGRFAFNQKLRGWKESDADLAKHKPDGKGGCSEAHTVVGSYLPNAWGLYDMRGNVFEWCLDWHGNLSDGKMDPEGAFSGTGRVVRGNCWNSGANSLDSSGRVRLSPSYGGSSHGFRLAISTDIFMDRRVAPSVPNVNGRDARPPSKNGQGVTHPSAGVIPDTSNKVQGFPETLYCVVDLSAGPNAKKYPVSYLNAEPNGGWTDEYKTTKLVLRRIEPGNFKMEGKFDVTITKAFYIGIFEVTQRQYELVTGSNPSQFKGDMRPIEMVSWNAIRGDSATYNWPNSVNVDSSTFIGKFQARTGLNVDLPTEAQWEYACRAGTTSKYNNGGDSEADLKQIGRFALNQASRGSKESDANFARHKPDGRGGCSEAHTVVGSYLPNAWGLYDMHGNVWEWCLDWWSNSLSSGETRSSGTSRVARGGCWYSSDAEDCTSCGRNNYRPTHKLNRLGFRVVVGPDLLKERGITPPKPDADGRDTRPPSVNGKDVRSPSAGVSPDTSKRAQGVSDALYCVVDLSAGPNAEKYPVSYLNAEPKGGWTEEYKTCKLVLRRIEPGSFKMGGRYDVTLTKSFYIGVFEVTQKQYKLVTGDNPSEFKGEIRPVEKVSYDMIRGNDAGAKWPASSAVDSDSFMGKLRTRTGLDSFDLPTEAQWEYACRAGTTSKYNNGGDSDDDLKKLGRFVLNQKLRGHKEPDANFAQHEPDGKGGCLEGHTVVGSYMPNAWGLYDMHGNVWERCLDWRGDLSGGATDPVGSSSGAYRVLRGGSWYNYAHYCTSSSREVKNPSNGYSRRDGFRIAISSDLLMKHGITSAIPKGNGRDAPSQDVSPQTSARSIEVFPHAGAQNAKWKKRAPWRYTMKVPPANWMEPGFRDGMWKRTNKPLGFGKDASFMRISERWNTSDVWLRRHFTWKKSGKVTEVVFDMLHDEDVEIYLNGTRILEEKGANTDWEPFSVSVETFMSAVKEGDNVLAVKVHDGAAPRCFDCGLTVQTEEVK